MSKNKKGPNKQITLTHAHNERITDNLLGWGNDDRKTKAIVGHKKRGGGGT